MRRTNGGADTSATATRGDQCARRNQRAGGNFRTRRYISAGSYQRAVNRSGHDRRLE